MMLWCPILPERRAKFEMIMRNLSAGWLDGRCVYGEPPEDDNPVACYGQIWGTEKILQRAGALRRPYWHIDNGFWKPGRGDPNGYYRFTYASMSARYLPNSPPERFDVLGIRLKPWRRQGHHILLALPGLEYGCGIGLNMPYWIQETERKLRKMTDRPIVVRDRKSTVPLEQDLNNCWALVTHSSNVAVDAVCAGVPVFVSSLSMAAEVGNLSLGDLEKPQRPERVDWCRSLACQQFTANEMRDGTAYRLLKRVEDAAHS
jgi:hypothetical protein